MNWINSTLAKCKSLNSNYHSYNYNAIMIVDLESGTMVKYMGYGFKVRELGDDGDILTFFMFRSL